MEVLFATANVGKLKDVNRFLEGSDIQVLSAGELAERSGREDLPREVDETGSTYEENAALKSRALFAWSHHPTIGDDSGLEVDALSGQPGLYSARYAGAGCSFDDNINKLLSALEGEWERRAKFVCVISYTCSENETHFFRGELEGVITDKKRGEGGFGYDPIFEVLDTGKTLAELKAGRGPIETHRTRALQKWIDYTALQ